MAYLGQALISHPSRLFLKKKRKKKTDGVSIHDRFGLNGKACILKTICELAESKGLPFNGMLGKAFETVFL